MKARNHNCYEMSMHQRGSALVVSLIMLLLLTLIGVAGMKDTLLQEKMVGNVKDRDMALQAAEAALRAAEASLSGTSALTMTNMNGLYDLLTSTATQRTTSEAEFWRAWPWSTGNSVEYMQTLEGVSSSPRYVIERLDPAMSNRGNYPGGSACSGIVCGADDPNYEEPEVVADYRITVRAVGSSADAAVILQATFRRDRS